MRIISTHYTSYIWNFLCNIVEYTIRTLLAIYTYIKKRKYVTHKRHVAHAYQTYTKATAKELKVWQTYKKLKYIIYPLYSKYQTTWVDVQLYWTACVWTVDTIYRMVIICLRSSALRVLEPKLLEWVSQVRSFSFIDWCGWVFLLVCCF